MRENRNKLIIIILTVVLSIILAIVVISDHTQEKRQAERIRQLKLEVKPYEQEISDIKKELSNREKEINIVEAVSQISLAFQVETATDIDWIEDMFSGMEQYEDNRSLRQKCRSA